ncbi:MAG: hypothetical protein M1822_008090 [Bathelium mastoideum]|nr:MAG: hypothetical protein M1822_008090 [Bathelium mastoideum]
MLLMNSVFLLVGLSSLLTFCTSFDTVRHFPLDYKVLYELDPAVSGSNLLPLQNGNILITTQSAPTLLEIQTQRNHTARSITTFPNEANTFGVVEVEKDVYYVGTANYTLAPRWSGIQGSNKIFRVNMTSGNPEVSMVVEISEGYTCDGLTVVNATSGLIVTGDTQSGTLYLIDVLANTYEPIYQSTQLNETAANPSELAHVGINGLKYYRGHLYFTVTSRGTFGRMPFSPATGRVSGSIEILNSLPLPDDIEVYGDKVLLTELQVGIFTVSVGQTVRDGKTSLVVDLPGANAVSWGMADAFNHCTLFALYNRKIINGSGSGLVAIDGQGTGLRGGC